MSVRDEPFNRIDVSTHGGGPEYLMVYGSGTPAGCGNGESSWDYVDDQPMPGFWECMYCLSLHKNEATGCSKCGAPRRKAQ